MSREKPGRTTQHQEIVYRFCYSTIINAVDARYDVRGSLLAEMVKLCLENRGRVPFPLRTRYDSLVQQKAISYLESFTAELLFGPSGRFSPNEYCYLTKL